MALMGMSLLPSSLEPAHSPTFFFVLLLVDITISIWHYLFKVESN